MYYRSSLSVVTLYQFLKELCLFLDLEYRKYTVFRSFLLHALTYWGEILHMTLFWCTTEQVRVSSLCVNFWRSYASCWNFWHFCWCMGFCHRTESDLFLFSLTIYEIQFPVVFLCTLWHILKYCKWLCFDVLQIKFECSYFAAIFEGVIPLYCT